MKSILKLLKKTEKNLKRYRVENIEFRARLAKYAYEISELKQRIEYVETEKAFLQKTIQQNLDKAAEKAQTFPEGTPAACANPS